MFAACAWSPRDHKRGDTKPARSQFVRQQQARSLFGDIRMGLVSEAKNPGNLAGAQMLLHQVRQPVNLRAVELMRRPAHVGRCAQLVGQRKQREVVAREARPAIADRALQVLAADAGIESIAPVTTSTLAPGSRSQMRASMFAKLIFVVT